MTATEFIKENYTLTNGGEDYICNHSGQLVGAEDIAEEYHQAKLKLLGIADVSGLACKCGNQIFTHRHSNWIECTACNKIQILQD
jgi:hypothetical protein